MKTPQQSYPELAKALGVAEIYLKREDRHKYGSHKGRSIPLMIKNCHEQGRNSFVISSSGNAALAAVLYIESHNRNKPDDQLTLTVFVGKNINTSKLVNLTSLAHQHINTSTHQHITIERVERPKQSAFQLDKGGKAKNLRQSTDDTALLGYHELAGELNKIPNLQAIFIPTSSGTTAQGLGEAFQKLENKPQIHVIQTETCNPIVSALKKDSSALASPLLIGEGQGEVTAVSIALAIVDKVAHRKEKVIETIKTSQGAGWIVSDDEIREAIKLVKEKTKVDISPNSALSVAGLKKAVGNGWKFDQPIVCIITGR